MQNTPEAQAAVAALRRNLTGTCWWCGGLADSREHKFKRSDLARLAGKDKKDKLYWGTEGFGKELQGYKRSNVTRFGKILCQRCNNERSQPFDLAYDTYSDFISRNLNNLWQKPTIPFDQLFGATWASDAKNLARYFTKNFGCLMADNGFQPPQSLRQFMNGDDECTDVDMLLVKDEALWLMRKKVRREGVNPGAGLWIGPSSGMVARDGSQLNSYHARTFVGYIGVDFYWGSDADNHDSFYHHPHPKLNQIEAPRKVKEMIREPKN